MFDFCMSIMRWMSDSSYLLNLTKYNIIDNIRAHTSLCNYFMYNQIRLVSGIVNRALFLSSYFFYLCFMHLYGKMFLFLCNRCYEIEIMCQEFCYTINKVSVLKPSLLCPWQSYISCAWSLFSIHFWNNVYVRFINHVLWFFLLNKTLIWNYFMRKKFI